MTVKEAPLSGLKIVQPQVFGDKRGYFMESWNSKEFMNAGITNIWVQDNEARSSKGVLRGLHYQIPPSGQAKLVRVIQGAVQDVVVDIRPMSDTYGQHFSITLSEDNKTQLYIPEGFAHGYLTLSDFAIFSYKCDTHYAPEHEGGILYNDPSIGIEWQAVETELIISEKDMNQPIFGEHKKFSL